MSGDHKICDIAQGKAVRRAVHIRTLCRVCMWFCQLLAAVQALKDEEDLPLAARRCGRHQPKKKWDSPECPAARAYTNRRASKRVLAPQPPPVVV